MELLNVSLQPVVLPFTVLMACVAAYWTLFIVGAVGLDMFDFDIDIDTDLDVGGVDTGIDGVVDGADLDVDAGDTAVTTSGGGWFVSLLRFINVGDVPLMVLASIAAFSLWALAVLLNDYFNPNFKTLPALGLLIPNFIASLFVTKLASWPFRQVFKHANAGIAAPIQIVGKTCIISTSKVTTSFGQATLQLPDEATPVTLNVRTRDTEVVLKKGDEAIVTEHNQEKNTYSVVPFKL